MVKFLKREATDGIKLCFRPKAERLDIDALTTKAKRAGLLNLGFHYVLRTDGELEEGIPFDQFANMELPGADRNIYVLVTSRDLTDAQRFALRGLSERLGLEVSDDVYSR